MPLEFFWGSGSCNSWRVHLALEIKKVPYVGRLLDMSKGEHKSPAHLALNPRGKVPAIRDGGFTLYESVAILLYLDRKYPEPPLFGRTPEEAGRILRQALELINYLEPKLDRMCIPIYRGRAAAEGDAIKAAAVEVHREVATLEATLAAEGPFLAGAALSAADCTALPFVHHMLRGARNPAAAPLELGFLPLHEKYPAVAAWLARMEALPGFDRTFPPALALISGGAREYAARDGRRPSRPGEVVVPG